MYCVEGHTIAEVWENSIRVLLTSPDAVWRTSAEGRCREIANVIMQVRDPSAEPQVSLNYPFARQILMDYNNLVFQHFEGLDSPNHRMYAWVEANGNRLNQIEKVVDKLRKSPETRTAMVSLWKPEVDLYSLYPMAPCLLYFSIRRDKLELSVIVRSNDAWFAAPANFIAFTRLQHMVAKLLALEAGNYCHHAFSYHIYEFDVPKAALLLL